MVIIIYFQNVCDFETIQLQKFVCESCCFSVSSTGTAHRNIPAKLPSGLKQLSIAKNDDKDFNESTPLLNGISSYTTAEEGIEVKRSKKSPSFVLTLIRVFGFYILEAHAGKLIADILTFIGPMVQGYDSNMIILLFFVISV